MLIFIIDDEPQQRIGMEKLIKNRYPDFEISSFRTGNDALLAMRQDSAQIVFSDIRMPHMTGLELTEAIHKINPKTVVVLISAYTEFEYARKAIDLGVYAYLIKPINPAEVFQILDRLSLQLKQDEKVELADNNFRTGHIDFDNTEQAINYVLRYISSNYTSRITIQEVADLCHYSVSHFSALFKAQTNMSFITYLNRFRLQKAAELLSVSSKKTTDIAVEVGFDDTKYFTRLFIREYGMTPNSYRSIKDERDEKNY